MHKLKYFVYTPLIILMYFFIAPIISAQVGSPGNPAFTEYVKVTAAADKYGLEQAAGNNFTGRENITDIVGNIILSILGIIGIIFLTLIIWGGAQWMTSGGNDQKIDKAKKIIAGATIGLIIIVLGYSITYFVVESITTSSALPVVTGPCPGGPGC